MAADRANNTANAVAGVAGTASNIANLLDEAGKKNDSTKKTTENKA